MNSDTLRDYKFGSWRTFNMAGATELLAVTPSAPGAYAIRTRLAVPRLKGRSDLLYIGSAASRGGLVQRFHHYFNPGPTQFTNQRLLARCGNLTLCEVSFVVVEGPLQARELEATLLGRYLDEHGELPPENRKAPARVAARNPRGRRKSKASRMFELIAQAPMGVRTRQQFEHLASAGDADGIWDYFRRCVKNRPDVGRSVQRAGQVSFESVYAEVQRIYESE